MSLKERLAGWTVSSYGNGNVWDFLKPRKPFFLPMANLPDPWALIEISQRCLAEEAARSGSTEHPMRKIQSELATLLTGRGGLTDDRLRSYFLAAAKEDYPVLVALRQLACDTLGMPTVEVPEPQKALLHRAALNVLNHPLFEENFGLSLDAIRERLAAAFPDILPA